MRLLSVRQALFSDAKLRHMPRSDENGGDFPENRPEDAQRDAWAEEVKDRLEAAWIAKGWSQNALAESIGRTSSALSQRMGSNLKEWWALFRMMQELGTSADEILGLAPTVGLPPAIDSGALKNVTDQLRAALDAAVDLQKKMPGAARRGPPTRRARSGPKR
jgi:transcriptional regulator with XRE-family HTH domain